MAATKRASGAKAAPARGKSAAPRAAKPAAATAPAAAAAPAVNARPSGQVELISVAKGSRTFGSASGRRYRVVQGEHFMIDTATAKLLLQDPDAFVPADQAEASVEPDSSGPITVESLSEGDRLAEPDEPSAAEASTAPSVDAAATASSDGGDQGGSEPADDPAAAAAGEAGTPPSSEEAAPGAVVLS
jgi:hypothetical protein